jgi:hypothetical protein
MFVKRVHIVPVGDNVERMVSPAIEMRADLVFLLADERASSPADADAIAEQLDAEGIETRLESVDQENVYAVLGLVTTLADRHANDEVRVNVSTGSRLATVGAALACMDDDTDAEAYHVSESGVGAVTDRDDEGGGVSVVPDYPIESPSRDEVATMGIVAVLDTDVYTPKKRDLIDEALGLNGRLEEPIPFAQWIVDSAEADGSAVTGFGDIDSDAQKGAYRTFRERTLSSLEAKGYVAVDDDTVGRSDPVTLTPTGRAALLAFRHKILDVVRAFDDREIPDWLTDGMEPAA